MGRRGKDLTPSVKDSILSLHEYGYSGRKIAELFYMPILSVVFWGCLTYEGVGTLEPVEGNINSRKYIQLLDEHFVASNC